MREVMAVFIGGGLGSLLRYGISRWLNPIISWLPLGTLTANVLACVFMGIVAAVLNSRTGVHPLTGQLLLAGFCGGFSTFSTFAMENHRFVEQQQWHLFMLYTGGSILLGLAGIYGGLMLGKKLF